MKRRSFVAVLGSLPIALAAASATAPTAAQIATPDGATTKSAATPVATPAIAGLTAPIIPLRVMTFNVWIGGEQVDFAKVVEAIRLAEADVVGIQEVEGNLPRIAEDLGWDYVNTRQQVISRFPIIDPPGAEGRYVLIEPVAGGVFAMTNVHLPSDPYGVAAVQEGISPADLNTLELETRLPALTPKLDASKDLMAQGFAVFLTGDFNSPSHLDWNRETDEELGVARIPFVWPVSKATEDAGFHDSYRVIYPNPETRFGYTWTAGYPSPLLRPGEPLDRIDFVWASDGVEVTASQIVGEAGGLDVDIPVAPFPSDHRAVVSAFEVPLATPPIFVATEQRAVTVGEPLLVRFHARGDQTDAIAIVPRDASADSIVSSLIPRETWVDGSVSFGTESMAPGAYDAVLVTETGEILSRSAFWVQPTGARPEVATASSPVVIGDPLTVAYHHAPGNRWDWIAVIEITTTDPQNYIGYAYTDAGIEGTVTIDTASLAEYLTPGVYRVALLEDDGYVILAETTVEFVMGS